ncbi:MAG: flagellar basal body protein, partial [Rhodomicrobium sp.]
MGLYSLLTTSASGMAAQSAWLNAISDNIANVSTVGYKQASTEFSSLVLSSGLTADYQSGSVIVDPRI